MRLNNATIEVTPHLLADGTSAPGKLDRHLTKTGTGQLNVNLGFVTASGSTIVVQKGTVNMNKDGGTSLAIQVSGDGAKAKLSVDQNLQRLIVSFRPTPASKVWTLTHQAEPVRPEA